VGKMIKRRKYSEDSERIPGYVPVSLMRQVRLLLLDPSTGKIEYASFSNLITQLLTEWLEKQKIGRETIGSKKEEKEKFAEFTNEGE
jgi:hypothetical protein